MTVNEKGICHIPGDDRCIVNIHIIYVIYYVDTLPLAGIRRFNDPDILLRIMLLQLLIVSIEITELVWKNICIRYKVEVALPELLLHPHHIIAQPVFPGYFIALREVIYFLILIQSLIQVALAARRAPQYVPLVRLRVRKPIALENGP